MVVNRKPTPVAIEAGAEMMPPDADEPNKAEILADLRQALKQALAGKGHPAREALAEIRRKTKNNAHPSYGTCPSLTDSVTLLTIYSKTEQTDISVQELRQLVTEANR